MADDSYAPPSRDPADDGSMLGMVKLILDKFLQGVDDMLPARVVAYDRTTNRASVVPLVKVVTTNNQQVGRAQVASVPVMLFGGGTFALSFPIKPGDLGWIKANDRDISIVLQAYADNAPNTLRKHSFQDAVFIPDVMRGLMIDGEDTDNATLQSLDGAVRVSIGSDRIKLTAGALSLTVGPSGIDILGPVTITGSVTVAGAISTAGGMTIDGIPFGTHRHTGVSGGPDTSGGPVA